MTFLYSQLNKYSNEVYNIHLKSRLQYIYVEIEEISYGFGENYVKDKIKIKRLT